MAAETRNQGAGLTEIRQIVPTILPRIETRGEGENQRERIIGQGVTFDSRSQLLYGYFYETITRDAMKETDMSDVVGLFNHDDNYVLGRSTSGTMIVELKSDGVYYDIEPSDAQWVRDLVMTPLRRGDIRGSSFQFTIPDEEGAQEWTYDKQNQVYHRKINKIERLIDVSVVTRPAYNASSSGLSARSVSSFEEYRNKTEQQIKEELEKAEDNKRQLEDNFLRSTQRARVRMYGMS